MSTEEFISELEEQGVVDADLARQLRAKASDDGGRVTPEAILKFLVKTDVITDWKSDELAATLLTPAAADGPEILDLQPLDDEDERPAPRRAPIDMTNAPPGAASVKSKGPPLFTSKAAKLDDVADFGEVDASGELGDAAGGGVRLKGAYRLGKAKGKKKGSNKKRTAGGKNQWDSPLLLLGGGALVVLIVGGAIIYYLLVHENADAVLTDANNLFDSGSYRQASARYEEFVKGFPNHKDVSRARVQVEMSKLWEAAETNAAAALPEAQRVITEIEDEQAFISGGKGEEALSSAKQDIANILVRVGKAIVEKAQTTTDQKQLVDMITQLEGVLAMSANDKYVPQQVRNEAALGEISESLEVIRSRQKRDERLTAALAAMDTSLAAGDAAGAYKVRLDLLVDYPALADDEALAERVRAASAAEQARVKLLPGEQKAETAWPQRAVVAELALAERHDVAAGAGAGEPLVVRVDGALYGLSSGDGALLWRRFAGFGPAGTPLKVDGDVVAADLVSGELWRLNASTGKLVWRLPLSDHVTGVVALGTRLLATAASGKLYVIEASVGALVGSIEFSQPIRTAPVVNDRGDRIYVAAEHSIIYTLSAQDLACIGVHYSGHAAGSIVAPPVAILNKVIVADNSGSETSRLRVLIVNDDGAVDREVASERLTGLVLTPLARAGRRVAAGTTVGQLAVVDISGAEDGAALSVVARREGREAQPLARFVLVHEGRLWVAAKQLLALDILPTESQLSARSLGDDFQGDAFDADLQTFGPLVIHVRRPSGRAGAIVAATDASAEEVAWQTDIAVPLAGAPAADSPRVRVSALTASAAAYSLDRAALARGVQDQSVRASGMAGEPPLTTSLDLGEGRMAAAAAGGERIVLFDPDNARQAVRKVDLGGSLACPLTMWKNWIVAPTSNGRVGLLDPLTTEAPPEAFMPELTPGRTFRWIAPATTGVGADAELLISDGQETLYRLVEKAEPMPHLAAAASIDVGPSPLATPLAVVGANVFAGTEDGRLAAYALPDLKPAEPIELGDRVAWGPHVCGAGLLLATEGDELIFVDGDGKIRWRQDLKHGACAGRPLVVEGTAFVLDRQGGVARIALADGVEAGYAATGQAAVAGPVALGERLIVATADGALVVINRP
jgi:outer membrane protein assembly factor BamB